MVQTLKALKVTFIVDSKGAVKGIKNAKGEVLQFGKEAKTAGTKSKGLGTSLRNLGPLALGAGGAMIALVAGFKQAIGASIKFEEGLREVGTLMGGLTEGEMAAMGDELKDLAVSSGQLLDKLVKARYDIISAGFADAAESAKLLKLATDLAIAGVADVAIAADLVTTVMKSFNFEVSEAKDITDKLMATVIAGKTTLDRMGGSLGRVLGIFGSLNVDINEVLGTFATLATVMGSSERAVTALGGTMAAILTPSAGLIRVMKSLGVETALALIEQEGFAGAIRLIADEAERLRIPITDVIKGQEALSGILPLTGTAAELLATNIESTADASGTVEIAVKEMEKATAHSLRRMTAAWAVLSIEIGDTFLPLIADIAEAIANIFTEADAVRIRQIEKQIELLTEDLKTQIALAEDASLWDKIWATGGTGDPDTVREKLRLLNEELDALQSKAGDDKEGLPPVFKRAKIEIQETEEVIEDINLDLLPTWDKLAQGITDETALTQKEMLNIIFAAQRVADELEIVDRQMIRMARFSGNVVGNLVRSTLYGRDFKEVLKDIAIQMAATAASAIAAELALRAMRKSAAGDGGGGDQLTVGQGAAVGLQSGGLVGAALGALAGLFFQKGGSFIVPGSGGPDSQFVPIQATPGERVTVETPAQQRQAGATIIQQITLNGPVDEEWFREIAAPTLEEHARRAMNNIVIA